jgi:hypothetical protein
LGYGAPLRRPPASRSLPRKPPIPARSWQSRNDCGSRLQTSCCPSGLADECRQLPEPVNHGSPKRRPSELDIRHRSNGSRSAFRGSSCVPCVRRNQCRPSSAGWRRRRSWVTDHAALASSCSLVEGDLPSSESTKSTNRSPTPLNCSGQFGNQLPWNPGGTR